MKNLNFTDHERGGVWHDFCGIKHVDTPSASKSNSSAFEQVKCQGNVIPTLAESPSNHPLITRLSPANHPLLPVLNQAKRVMRAAMVILMLFVGVGQMWGWNFSGDNFIYFHNKGGWNDSGKMLFIGKSSYSSVYTMSAVTGNSSLWVVKITNAGWSDATYMAVAGGSNVWGSGSWGPSNRTNATHYTNTYTSGVDASNNQRYMLTPASGSNNANLSLAYLGTGEPNYTITVKAKVSTNGGSSYSEATSPGTLLASSKKFTAYNSCNSTTSLSSGTITCGYYATTTLTAPSTDPTGYTFVGWYNSDGTQQTTSKTLTIYPTANATYYAYYKANQYNGTINANGGAENKTYTATYGTTSLTIAAAPTRTGYNLTGYYKESGCSNLIASSTKELQASTSYTNASKQWTNTSSTAPTLYAGWTAKTTTITLINQDATTAGSESVVATYGAAMPAITLPAKDGYIFGGYWGAPGGSGPKYYNADGSSAQNWENENSTYSLYAYWIAQSYTVTFDADEEHKGTIAGATGSQNVTYGSATVTVPNLPRAEAGYGFMGYYTEQNGNGSQVINASGEWIASVSGYTDSDKNWVHADNATLYAYYRKAAISSFTFAGGTNAFAPGADVTVTANLTPQPEGTTIICWRVLYGNGNALDPQPSFTPSGANTVTFAASETSGSYKIEATLRLGSTCGSGEVLSTQEIGFQVAGDHTVTLQYKCGDEVIAPSGSITGKPLEWSSAIAAPDIFGYTFHHWLAGDGITLSENGTSAKTGARPDSSTVSPIYIKAIYDGRLTAVYTQKNMIYFKNTLGWSDVYVNFYTGSYWNNPKGSGNKDVTNRNKHMTRLGETDIWYYDYGASITPSLYVSFTSVTQANAEFFWGSGTGVNVVYPANYQDAIHTDKSSENGFKAATPMFVPLAGQAATVLNNSGGGKANYFNRGYWTKYTPGTGYTLEIYNSTGGSLLKTIEFTAEDDLMPMEATADLEAGTTYKYQIRRGGTGSAGIYYGNSGTMTYANHGVGTGWEMTNAGGMTMAGITTNAAGEYTFHLSYSANASSQYRLRMAVDYPIANGDYRVIYKDNVHTAYKPSAIVPQKNDGKDTVSFFIRPSQSPVMKIQQATVASNGNITWSAGTDISSELTAARCPKDSVYNICLTMDANGAISVENIEAYTGDFYIRTDAANSKWDNYRSFDHLMTYSEYSEKNSNFTHYWMAHVGGGTNVKFVVANDYSPCISDTLAKGDDTHVNASGNIAVEANIRFMWHRHTNTVQRAYLSPAQNDGSKFLVLRGTDSDNILSPEGEVLRNGNNHGAPDHCMQFDDDENWIYETTVQVKPSTFVKLYAYFHGSTFYYRGKDNNTFDETNAITLITGDGTDPVRVRVIYDFKTDRLLAAWLPEGNISEEKDIHADVMFIREHQGDISQLTFSGTGKITDIYSAYAVMKFNKWTLNNKHKDTHAPLASPASVYERSLYWVSFPFRVKLNDVFGFGKYMQHWAIQKYNGARRAAEGFWAESSGFWEWMDNNTEYLEPNQGYLLALDLDLLGEDSPIWNNNVQNIELFFPSYGTMPDITSAVVAQTIPEHACTINRAATEGLPDTGDPRTSYNRTVFDSHWNVLSVPTYVNTENIAFANTTWTSSFGPRFLYTWNSNDNTLTATVASGYKYHAMHSYFVQYGGGVTWTASSGSPYSIVARRTYSEEPAAVNFCLEVQQNEEMVDRTYIQLSADEEVSNNFVFGEDMTKEFNSRSVNIYTIVENMAVAGNTQPMSNQTTVVPVGVETKSGGEYTFAMPAGTEGIGVILVDNEAGTRTNLSLTDYTVTLNTGKNDNRFVLEISPIAQSPTGIENDGTSAPLNDEMTKGARKALVDGILYIVKDGKVFDARGGRVD